MSNLMNKWIFSFCKSVIAQGAIPNHVAFIMDGNRRFATKINLEKHKGHYQGFLKLQ